MGEMGVVTFFVLEVPDYESTMLMYFIYIYIYTSKFVTLCIYDYPVTLFTLIIKNKFIEKSVLKSTS